MQELAGHRSPVDSEAHQKAVRVLIDAWVSGDIVSLGPNAPRLFVGAFRTLGLGSEAIPGMSYWATGKLLCSSKCSLPALK